jgi:hypothetical protein
MHNLGSKCHFERNREVFFVIKTQMAGIRTELRFWNLQFDDFFNHASFCL